MHCKDDVNNDDVSIDGVNTNVYACKRRNLGVMSTMLYISIIKMSTMHVPLSQEGLVSERMSTKYFNNDVNNDDVNA